MDLVLICLMLQSFQMFVIYGRDGDWLFNSVCDITTIIFFKKSLYVREEGIIPDTSLPLIWNWDCTPGSFVYSLIINAFSSMKAIAKVVTSFQSASICKVLLCDTLNPIDVIKDVNITDLVGVWLLDTEETSQISKDAWNKALILTNGNIEFPNGVIIGSEGKVILWEA